MATVGCMGKRRQSEQGFTLIELSVVIIIIGILIAVATVTLLGARERASNTAAKARVTDALKTERVIYTDGNGFSDSTSVLEQAEPSLDFRDDTVVAGAVFVRVEGDVVTLASQSATGTCYWVKDSATVPQYATGGCSTDPEALAALPWGPSW